MEGFLKLYVRDALLEMGLDPTKGKTPPKLSDDQVGERAYRSICIYEHVAGQTLRSQRGRWRSPSGRSWISGGPVSVGVVSWTPWRAPTRTQSPTTNHA
eukprot:10034279-Lingulodinium_polyedra.AAC.1